MTAEISLEQRQADWVAASDHADKVAAEYTEMRARGVRSLQLEDAMDRAQAELRRATRRLHETQRRLQGRGNV